MPINQSVIVTGPQGCGKTRNAIKIRNHFNLTWVIDNWSSRTDIISTDRLYLSNWSMEVLRRNHGPRVMIVNYADVMAQIDASSVSET